MSRRNGRQAVYIVLVPENWAPQRPWDFPPRILCGELFVKNVSMQYAHGFCRTYNKRAVQARETGLWDHKWAVVVKHVKFQRHGRHPGAAKVQRGAV